jgi:FKBP-type peptidyl-prolyl cis-trans isomerase
MRNTLVFTLISLLILCSCGNESSIYPGFSVTSTNIHYKLVAIGEGGSKAQPTNYVTVSVSYRTTKDSIFFHGIRTFQLTEPQFPGAIDECFTFLAKGDSAIFYLSANDFFTKTLETNLPRFFNPEDFLRVDIFMVDILTEKQFELDKEAFLHWIEDFGEYEKVILKQYIQNQELNFEPTQSGLYYIPVQAGSGNKIRLGDTVTVHWEGRFFNGKFFDSTRKRNEPFQFVYGQKWQVVPGLEEAIGMMYPGERSLFIVPSHLAFGQEGSTTGIVPAFTSVIFEVEIVEVNPRKE